MPVNGLKLDGPKIRYLRENLGHTLRSFADISGVGYGNIGHIERGSRRASPTNAKKIADALGVTVKEIRA